MWRARPAQEASGLQATRRRAYRGFLVPAVFLYTLLFILPSIAGLVVSFSRWGGLGTEFRWAGLANYRALWRDPVFGRAFGNTLFAAIVGGVVVFALVFLALVVLQDLRGRKFVQAVLFMPHVISTVAIGACVAFLLDSDGALNRLMGMTGLPQHTAWLGDGLIFKVIVAVLVWSAGGYFIVLIMASVDNVPPDLYEEAQLAGCSKVQRFRHVTLPLVWDVIAVTAVLWVISTLKAFEMVIAIAGQSQIAPISARTVVLQQFYAITPPDGSDAQFGYASAMGVVMVFVSFLLVWLTRRVTRRERMEY
ncbi:carbohydrate ABC transporter permease [Longispora fulva]|uniref:Raffinose/stachyose/melibiose transport system permease protein n=1 Tax=Longispora fulva TaxID=619741 RepID=A0A8J7GD27_9ACTN|nr:sugar ABC transporter permease [Longispora fulva]MBG6135815.1 raffinose/stachyose/melibiose transport system permease protein [Longispora fulva]